MNEIAQKFVLMISVIPLLFSGCATTPTTITPITKTSERITRDGFSILPPQEEGWGIIKLNEDTLSLGMSGKNIDESYVIVVELIKFNLYEITGKNNFEKLVNYDLSINPNSLTSNRLEVLSSSRLPYSLRKEQCTITHILAKNYAATKKSDNPNPILESTYTLLCLHPYISETLVRLGFSHRHYEINKDDQLEEKAHHFFNKVLFMYEDSGKEWLLLEAIGSGDVELVKELLNVGYDVNKRGHLNITPLMKAVQKESTNIVKILLEYGADVDMKDSRFTTELMLPAGETPLITAARKGNIEIVKILLEYGADVDKKDSYGQTALDFATQKGYKDIVWLIKETKRAN